MTLETVNTLSLCCSHCRCVATISWVYLLVQFKDSKVSKLERFTNSNTWTWGTGLKISEFFSNVLHCPSPRSWSHSWCHVPDQSRKSWPLYGRSIGHFWQQRLCECTIHTQKKNVFPQFELLCRGYETLTLQSLWNDFLLYFLFCCIFHADWLFFWNSSDFVDGQDFFGSCCCKESAAFSVRDVSSLKACGTITHIFGSQKVEALSHLKGKPQQVVNVQWPVDSLLTQRDYGGRIRWKQCRNHWK